MSECVYCQNTFEMNETCSDEFRMWQGLVGPYYIPSVDENGILSWTNTGELPNPDAVDISGPAGASFSIAGIVETVGDLPAEAEGVWLVGDEPPYEGYSFVGGAWEDIGEFAIGPQGPQGDPGQAGAAAGFGTPTATITNTTGIPSVTVTASGPDTAKVFDFAFSNLKGAKGDTGSAGVGVPTGGTTGQVLAKASSADYDAEWVNQSAGVDPATATPLMDGTAAVGTATKYAREDHVHPTDTSRASASDVSELSKDLGTFVRPNLLDNWYFVGGGSQQGDGQFPINQRGQTTYTGNNNYSIDRWKMINSKTSVSLLSTGLKLSTTSALSDSQRFLQQTVYNSGFAGKKVTVSILISDYSIVNGSIRVIVRRRNGSTTIAEGSGSNITASGLVSLTYTAEANTDNIQIDIQLRNGTAANEYITISAMKLEIGDTQTIAHQENGTWVLNEIPNFADELARCQRYYQLFRTQSLRPTYAVDFRPCMATESPTLGTETISGITYYTASSEP